MVQVCFLTLAYIVVGSFVAVVEVAEEHEVYHRRLPACNTVHIIKIRFHIHSYPGQGTDHYRTIASDYGLGCRTKILFPLSHPDTRHCREESRMIGNLHQNSCYCRKCFCDACLNDSLSNCWGMPVSKNIKQAC